MLKLPCKLSLHILMPCYNAYSLVITERAEYIYGHYTLGNSVIKTHYGY